MTAAEATDFVAVEEHGFSQTEWGKRTGRSQQAVSANVAKARSIYNEAITMQGDLENGGRNVLNGSLDDVNFCRALDNLGNPVVTYHPHFQRMRQPTTTKLRRPEIRYGSRFEHDNPTDALGDRLVDIASILTDPEKATFGIRNVTGYWFGYGIGNFYAALAGRGERYSQQAEHLGETDYREAVFLRGPLANEDGYISIAFRSTLTALNIESLTVGFLTNGVPMDSSPYQALAEAFSTRLRPARTNADYNRYDCKPYIEIRPEDIIERITSQQEYRDESRVEKLLIENPIDRRLLSDIADDDERFDYQQLRWLEPIADLEHVFVEVERATMNDEQSQSAEESYLIDQMEVTRDMNAADVFASMNLTLYLSDKSRYDQSPEVAIREQTKHME